MKATNNTIWNYLVRYVLIIVLSTLTIASILFFNISFSTTNDIAYEQSSEMNKQIILNFENYISSLIDTSDYIESQIEKYDVSYDKPKLYDSFNLAIELQKDIESIDLYDESGLLLFENAETRLPLSMQWFNDAMNNKNVYNFSKSQETHYNDENQVISLSKYTTYIEKGEERKGVLRIDINFDNINELVNITNLGEDGAIIFIDENNNIIFSSVEDARNYENREISDIILGEFKTNIHNNYMLVNVNTIANTRWRMVTYLNRNIIMEARNNYVLYFFIVLILSAGLAIWLAFRFTKKITQPIVKLKDTLISVEPNKLDLPITVEDYDEIRILNETINKMSVRINNLMQSVIEEQEAKAGLQLDILQHQINPHFLYNTLDTIVVLSENDKKTEVVNTIVALAKYFRINLSGGSKLISVQQELEQIENYLKIQKTRYQTRFEYEIQIDQSLLEYEVLKLILQPLVENAIYHGTSLNEKSRIIISHDVKDDFYFFRVANSGYGLTEKQIEEIYKNMQKKTQDKSVGLRNVYQRIKLHYGEDADILFEVDDKSYTIVSIKIPLNKLERVKP
ncbi:MAG: sensor histidine kinase [Clostridia bacterium]|nr:sensor histidine kinase [Clostridia bacterium]